MNNKCKFLIVLFLIFMVATLQVQAEKYKGPVLKKSPKADAYCFPPSKNTNLALNNVRALLKTNGTMWFLERAEYEVPRGSGKTSLFSASLWIGGLARRNDITSLHIAAMRFAQDGNDYWTGPLRMKEATIDQPSCSYYDKFYRMTRIEVERHIEAMKDNDPSYVMPISIKDWPAHGRSSYGESRFLAPFFDVDGNGEYEPEKGDFPYYDFANELCPWTIENKERAKEPSWLDVNGEPDEDFGRIHNPLSLPKPPERIDTRERADMAYRDNKMIYADHVLKGDETIFWFLNDMGGPHKETGGASIGVEIRVQAFAFATNDELNKMTFYSYEIINRGLITLYDTYFSQWCDPDLGYADDDFIGCDVNRGLGYCYNGTEIDGKGEIWAYGENPPAVGLDFFQGPYIDPDGSDNPKFHKDKADINNPEQAEYCKKFVHYIVNKTEGQWGQTGAPDDLTEVHESQTLIVERDSAGIILYDAVPIRWNNQFAINGVNFGDGIADNERFGMRAFTYHNNGTSGSDPRRDPHAAVEHYYYLTARWSDGTPFSYGGTGYLKADDIIVCDFVFPGGTDYCNWGTKGEDPGAVYNYGGKTGNWSERMPNGAGSAPNTPGDRRFMQSAGPFTLKQGACNYVTVGVPWARSMQGGVEASIALLMVADDKCQALFENCFKILDGPDAPNLTIREYDQKLVLLLTNSPQSNNANEDYHETDQRIQALSWLPDPDREYRFEGYQIFQVAGPEVGANDLDNPSLARLVRQYDLVNFNPKTGFPIGKLINWEFDEDLQLSVPKEKVNGSNTGIEHSFEITQDVFATGSRQLVNYKTYYFIAVAYAYNEFAPYSINAEVEHGLEGQQLPYLRGRKTAEGRSVVPIPAVPHPPTGHGGTATLQSDYGSIPYITRIDGQGNGGIALDLSQETINEMFEDWKNGIYTKRELKYEKNAGPLNIKVIDPLRIKPFDYTLVIKDPIMDNDSTATIQEKNRTDVSENAFWILTIDESVSDSVLRNAGLIDARENPIREFKSQTTIGQYYEQIIIPLGISVAVYNTDFVSRDPKFNKFFNQVLDKYKGDMYRIKHTFCQTEKINITNDIVFENNGYPWITGLVDDNVNLPSNWIRSGAFNLGAWTINVGEQVRGNFNLERLEDFHFPSGTLVSPDDNAAEDRSFKDYLGKFGTMCGGTWAPYVLSSPFDNGPQAKYTQPEPRWDYSGEEILFLEPTTPDVRYGRDLHIYYDFKNLQNTYNQPGYNQTLTNLYSVNVVLTPDKSKWTRCVVLEACQDPDLSEGNARKHEPRKHISVKQDGSPDYDSEDGFEGEDGKFNTGMGWFPGYAINIETGERLNMMFAENSDRILNEFGNMVNGNDMIFNPTSTYAIAKNDIDIYGYFLAAGTEIRKPFYDQLYEEFKADMLYGMGIERVWGGMHYVYVCNSAGNTSPLVYLDNASPGRRNFNANNVAITQNYGGTSPNYPRIDLTFGGKYDGYMDVDKKYPYYECGPYDKGAWLVEKFKQFIDIDEYFKTNASAPEDIPIMTKKHSKMQLFNNVMYTFIPLQPDDTELQKHWLSCDVTYKLRVTRPYLRYISRWFESPDKIDYKIPPEYEQYQGWPVYKISTKGLEPTLNDTRLYQSILDNINIVPNPYYGSSLYENNALETMIKITNLPTDLKNGAPVTINIYTVNGILVRTLTKGDSETSYVNWDLKNYANIPIASGVYIIHVNCPGIGERLLKFFCTMRQTDLNNF